MNSLIPTDLIERFINARDHIILDKALDLLDSPLSQFNSLDTKILKLLSRDGRLQVGTICAHLAMPPSTISSSLKRLDKLHIIKREINPENMRTFWVSLRTEGLRIVNNNRKIEENFARQLLEKIEGQREREAFLRSFETILSK